MTALGRYLGCYKLSLECKTPLIHFYSKCGFNVDEGNNFMVQRFDQSASNTHVHTHAMAQIDEESKCYESVFTDVCEKTSDERDKVCFVCFY